MFVLLEVYRKMVTWFMWTATRTKDSDTKSLQQPTTSPPHVVQLGEDDLVGL